MTLNALSPEETDFCVETELTIPGKIGEFSQPMIRKKADDMMLELARNVSRQMMGAGTPGS